MRNRLVVALVGMTVAVIALYGVPRAYVLADLVNRQEERKVERSADQLAALIGEREQAGRPVTAAYLEQFLFEGEGVEYVAADGTEVRAGQEPEVMGIVERRPVAGGGVVTLRRLGSLVEARVHQALLPVVVLGLGLLVASVVVGWLLARRLSRPFQELAGAATGLGTGRFDLELREYAMPEARDIAEALSHSARQLDELVRRERDFAVNASHELRSPVTALRLQLEDLAMWPQTPPEVAAGLTGYLGELDRLNEAIDRHLGRAQTYQSGRTLDLDLAVASADAVQRWRAAGEDAGRRVVDLSRAPVRALVDPGVVDEVLDALIDDALRNGQGAVAVEARNTPTHVTVTVSDDGRRRATSGILHLGRAGGLPDEDRLGTAAELVEAIGGRLSLAGTPSNTFVLSLPKPSLSRS